MSDRIRLIDALRGLSLAGIAMAHFGEQYLGFMPPPGQPYNIHWTADGVLVTRDFGVFCRRLAAVRCNAFSCDRDRPSNPRGVPHGRFDSSC